MGLWSRIFSKRQQQLSEEESLLVISDMHLGEDVLISSPESAADLIRALNRELAEFVSAHCEHPVPGCRYHLVVNGDMFDLVKVSVKPDAEEAFWLWSRAPKEAERPGLPNAPDNTTWKLGRILEIHRPLFKQLARFLMHGHRMTIIEGNHDAELYFDEVQTALREFIVEEAHKHHRRDKVKGEFNADEIAQRVAFRTWFEASPGRYHIEHGHQYDEFCSFEYQLAPLERTEDGVIATPMTHRLMPHFAELLGDFSTHGVDEWSFVRWLRFVFALGPRIVFALFAAYFKLAGQFIRLSGKKRAAELKGMEDSHRARLAAMVENSPYGAEMLRNLDRISAVPAEYSILKMIRVLYLDRFLVIFGALIAWTGALIVGGWSGVQIALMAAIIGGLIMLVMSKTRADPVYETLREAAARIADETGARYVVMGHSHKPELIDLKAKYGVGRFGENAYYINCGSWVTREILQGESGHGMSYVEISNQGAELKRWLGADREPVTLASTIEGRQPILPAEAEAATETNEEPAA